MHGDKLPWYARMLAFYLSCAPLINYVSLLILFIIFGLWVL
jgi:hypothetical protein